MFDIGWAEMAVVLLVALIVIGPKDLPKVARAVGRWVGKARAMAREFQRSFEDMAREAELEEIRRELDRVGRERIDLESAIGRAVDPDGSLTRALESPASMGSANRGQSEPPGTAMGREGAVSAEASSKGPPVPASVEEKR